MGQGERDRRTLHVRRQIKLQLGADEREDRWNLKGFIVNQHSFLHLCSSRFQRSLLNDQFLRMSWCYHMQLSQNDPPNLTRSAKMKNERVVVIVPLFLPNTRHLADACIEGLEPVGYDECS
jgi:hypothetical protein